MSIVIRMAMKVTEAIICAPGAFMPSKIPTCAAGITPAPRVHHIEKKKTHDERGCFNKLIEPLRFGAAHLETKRVFVAKHDAEHEDRHEPAGAQAVRGDRRGNH